ncbi:hypothetical protein ACLB2K_042182 [Fragaria x ananassa]
MHVTRSPAPVALLSAEAGPHARGTVSQSTVERFNGGFGGDGYSEVKHDDARAIPGWVTYWEAAPELPETKP